MSAKESENVNPTVTVTEGADIFDPSKINFNATVSMDNPFFADYNKAVRDMQAYTPSSSVISHSVKESGKLFYLVARVYIKFFIKIAAGTFADAV